MTVLDYTFMRHVPKLSSLSVFYPCYNEEASLIPLTEACIAFLPQVAKIWEIIIVDDGSTDKTAKIGRQLAKKYSAVSLVSHQKNRGYGAALQTGFRQAKYSWTFFTDGDRQFDVTELARFIPFTSQYRGVIGYRSRRAEGSFRAFNAYLFKLFVGLLFRVHVRDIDCAFKLYQTDLIQAMPLLSQGAMINAEILYRLKKKHVQLKQLPVQHYPRQFGLPTGNNLKVIIKAGYEAFKVYATLKFGKEGVRA